MSSRQSICSAAERRHDFAREKVERSSAHFPRNSRNRKPADEMARLQFSLETDDLLNTRFCIGQDNPVFGEAFNGEFARRALDDRVRPPEVHPLECLNKRIPCCINGVFLTACDKDVAKQGNIAFAFSHLSARFPIHSHTRCDTRQDGCGARRARLNRIQPSRPARTLAVSP